jgi:hypothetical protein
MWLNLWLCSYCEAPVEELVNPGHAHHLGGHLGGHHLGAGAPAGEGLLHRTKSNTLSSSSDDEEYVGDGVVPEDRINADDTATTTPGKPRRKRGLLNKILHH